ncbi:UDP-glycosyltransferase 74E2 [Vitis vinifera]|nr:UDP-glycosyltransferase 74E2 [Vitis vinifera]
MEGERRNEMKRNAERWEELAKEAVNEGGSSDKNIQEFVAAFMQLRLKYNIKISVLEIKPASSVYFPN